MICLLCFGCLLLSLLITCFGCFGLFVFLGLISCLIGYCLLLWYVVVRFVCGVFTFVCFRLGVLIGLVCCVVRFNFVLYCCLLVGCLDVAIGGWLMIMVKPFVFVVIVVLCCGLVELYLDCYWLCFVVYVVYLLLFTLVLWVWFVVVLFLIRSGYYLFVFFDLCTMLFGFECLGVLMLIV